MSVYILGIESSCDDTSAAIFKDTTVLSNKVANQDVHMAYGGVVPELASRAHQQNIIPVVDKAFKEAGIKPEQIDAIAFTQGPGLMGSLLVGTSFAKAFALANNIPLIGVNHLHAHIMAHFINEPDNELKHPDFPFLCLLVSGGNSQIVLVKSHKDMEVIGQTIDDAAGEAFDKCAKVMGLPYPGGPLIDKLAKEGNPDAFTFAKPGVKDYNYSFSGLKTSFLYFLRDRMKENSNFIEENKKDLCASLQNTIIKVLLHKLKLAAKSLNIKQVALAGGVSANSGLRDSLEDLAKKEGWNTFIPKFAYTTDNAAMVTICAYYKYLENDFVDQSAAPFSRVVI